MMKNLGSFGDIQEKLLELGATAKKKTTTTAVNSYVNFANKAFEAVTGVTSATPSKESSGSPRNHDTLPPHIADMASQFKDQRDLAKVRSQLAGFQNQGATENEHKPAFNSFFRQYKQEEETYIQRLKREKQEKLQQEKHVELQKEHEKEKEKEERQSSVVPQGRIRKSIFGKVKKRATMLETKVNAGKQ